MISLTRIQQHPYLIGGCVFGASYFLAYAVGRALWYPAQGWLLGSVVSLATCFVLRVPIHGFVLPWVVSVVYGVAAPVLHLPFVFHDMPQSVDMWWVQRVLIGQTVFCSPVVVAWAARAAFGRIQATRR